LKGSDQLFEKTMPYFCSSVELTFPVHPGYFIPRPEKKQLQTPFIKTGIILAKGNINLLFT